MIDLADIDTIAVLGAGNMGHGIAEVAALAGYEVRLRDIKDEFVQDGYDQIEWSLGKLAEKGQLSDEEADDALDRVTPLVDLEEAASDADVVIEAVPEKMDIKKEVYRELEQHAPEHAIFATNTSSLSITELSEVTERPEQFCGMHFFNPPVRMQLVEVISGAHTADETIEVIEDLAEDFDKTPVRVRKDSPGFIVNRILVPLMNEAAWLVHEDEATIAEVDSTVKFDMGLPMGAFELADQVGVDVSYHVLDYMHEQLGEAYAPAPLLEQKLDAEELGKKTGKGFYDYDDGGVDVPPDAGTEEIENRLVGLMANEVAKLVANDVAPVADIDQAVQLGGGFPEGPAKMADGVGLETLVETLETRHDETGAKRYEVAETLREKAEAGGFYDEGAATSVDEFEVVDVEYPGDMVAHLKVDRPHRMNTINPQVLDELDAALDVLEDDEDVRAILLSGAGDRAFSAGADVQSVAAGSGIEGVELSRRGQEVFGRLESVSMPVLAAIQGFCLGGGMELATGADMRIAAEGAQLGQPEHNLGLMPGWGGTQRLSRIVGEGRAKEIIFTGERYDPETLADYGFINEVVPEDELEERALELATDLAAGPPIAQKFTKRAMLEGRDDIDAGLELEAYSFGHLLTTEDVMEGVSAFSSDREPEFTGK